MRQAMTHRKRWGFDNVVLIIDVTSYDPEIRKHVYSAGIYPWPWPKEYLSNSDVLRAWLHDPKRTPIGRTDYHGSRKEAFDAAERAIGEDFTVVQKIFFH